MSPAWLSQDELLADAEADAEGSDPPHASRVARRETSTAAKSSGGPAEVIDLSGDGDEDVANGAPPPPPPQQQQQQQRANAHRNVPRRLFQSQPDPNERSIPNVLNKGGTRPQPHQDAAKKRTYYNGITTDEGHSLLRKAGLGRRDGAGPSGGRGPSRRGDIRLADGASAPVSDEPECSPEQKRAIEAALESKNVFITGGAGVGKSFIVHKIVSLLRKQGRRVAVTASTGIAAVNVNGSTLHSFAGIGIDKETKEVLADKAYKQYTTRKRWQQTDVLLIDEVSMVSANFFDTLNWVGMRLRGSEVNGQAMVNPMPFGGIKIIAVGDLFQLPPVERENSFVFESAAWGKMNFVKIKLERVWRQRDPDFVHLLRELRLGSISDENFAKLEACNRPLDVSDDILPTKLYPHRRSVDSENKKFFDQLGGAIVQYNAIDFCSSEKARSYLGKLNNDVGVPSILETKLRMQVMLKTNINIKAGLCNGSRGVVIGYVDFSEWYQKQSQQEIRIKYGGNVGPLEEFRQNHVHLPKVLFANGMEQVIPPQCWERKVLGNKASVSRLQIPLIPAWALTIHKCQGMSLDKVHINLLNSFGCGMTYVALSRARSIEGLHLEGLERHSIKVNQKVLAFYRSFDDPNAKGPAEGEGAGGRPWSRELEEHVYDTAKMSIASAMTQAMGSKELDLDLLRKSFHGAVARALKEVTEECQEQLDRFTGPKKNMPCDPNSNANASASNHHNFHNNHNSNAPTHAGRDDPNRHPFKKYKQGTGWGEPSGATSDVPPPPHASSWRAAPGAGNPDGSRRPFVPTSRGGPPPPPPSRAVPAHEIERKKTGELKRWLESQGVDTRGCIERKDLVASAEKAGLVKTRSPEDIQATQSYHHGNNNHQTDNQNFQATQNYQSTQQYL